MKLIKKHKYVCSKCGHKEKKKNKTLILETITTGLLIGQLCALFAVVVIGPMQILDMVSDGVTGVHRNYLAMQHNEELRAIAINYTTFDGYDGFKFAMDLASNLPRVRYVKSNRYDTYHDVLETFYEGGDCKHSAIMFVGMMRAIGYEAIIDCSSKYHHCVSKIPYQRVDSYKPEYMIIDLTSDTIRVYNNSIDHWENSTQYNWEKVYIKK